MPILRRDDGLQFIIHPYREVFRKASIGLMRKQIRMLSREHGGNLRVFRTATGELEVVASRDAGFLLGESIWIYLNKPNNLIYCEALFERNYALMVVVRNGVVLIDAKISYSEVMEELAGLGITDEKYNIYTYGDVPLGKQKEFEGNYFIFDQRSIASFEVLKEPLMPKLPTYEVTQLQPLEVTLTSPEIGKSRVLPIIAAFILVILVAVGWKVYDNLFRVPVQKQMAAVQRMQDPYEGYYSGLSSPSPKKQLLEFVSVTELMNSLPPGWIVGKINFDGKSYKMDIVSTDGSSMEQIRDWMDMNKMKFVFNTDKQSASIESKVKTREKPKDIYPLQDVLIKFIDETNLLLTGTGKVIFERINDRGSYKEAEVSIHIDKAIEGILFLIGNEINRLPVAISSIEMTIFPDHSFSGDIKLKVFGD